MCLITQYIHLHFICGINHWISVQDPIFLQLRNVRPQPLRNRPAHALQILQIILDPSRQRFYRHSDYGCHGCHGRCNCRCRKHAIIGIQLCARCQARDLRESPDAFPAAHVLQQVLPFVSGRRIGLERCQKTVRERTRGLTAQIRIRAGLRVLAPADAIHFARSFRIPLKFITGLSQSPCIGVILRWQ